MAIKASPRFRRDSLGNYGIGAISSRGVLGDPYRPGGRQDDRGGRPGALISMGTGTAVKVHHEQPVQILPGVVPRVATPPPAVLPPASTGGTEPPQPVKIQVSWADWVAQGNALPVDWNKYPHASDHPTITGVVYQPTVLDEEEPMSILGDIYDIVDVGIGGWLPGGPAEPSFLGTAPPASVLSGMAPAMIPATTVIPGTGGPMAAPSCPAPTMCYNSKTGKWTKKRRRRRKQLATPSDIRDLNALIAALGNGKALQSWIATHS